MFKRIEEILNEKDFKDYICFLLDVSGFKIEIITEGAGSDGGRDIEATSFEYDTAEQADVCTHWWIELKYRSNSNLGIRDLNDLSSKIIRAANNNIDKFLIITNSKLSIDLITALREISHTYRIPLKIWDLDKINNISYNFSLHPKHKFNIKMSDRNNETSTIINIIKSKCKNIVQITGKRGIGKSLLAKFIAQYMCYTENYGYGYIDCKNYRQIGIQIKEAANSFKLQDISSDFVDSISVNRNENERAMLLCRHIQNNKTILILDNLEYVLDRSRNINSPQIEILLKYALDNAIEDSIIITTSQLHLNSTYTSNSLFIDFTLNGWDINYIIQSYIKNLSNIYKQVKQFNISKEEQKKLFECMNGNPFAFNILNQLCESHNLIEILNSLKKVSDVPSYLLEQLSGEISQEQSQALERIAQFNGELSFTEITQFICNETTLDSLLYRKLIEKSSMFDRKYFIHPLTTNLFALNDDESKKSAIVKELSDKIEEYVSQYHIDDLYPHILMRKVIDMNVSIHNFEKVAEILVCIGTRILSMGDIYYLSSIMDKVKTSNISELIRIRLMKLEAHIASYSDRLDVAKTIYEDMLNKSINLNDPWSISAALNGLGSMARYVYDYPTAIKKYTESANIREKNGLLLELSNSYHNIGATYIISRNYPEAIDTLNKACEIRKNVGDKFRLSASMLYLGEGYLMIGNYPKAYEILLDCLSIKNNINDITGSVWACCALAKLYIVSNNQKDLHDFEIKLIEYEKIAFKFKMYRHLALIRIYMGINAFLKGDYSNSIGYYNSSLECCYDFRKELLIDDIKKLTMMSLNFSNNDDYVNTIIDIVKNHKI